MAVHVGRWDCPTCGTRAIYGPDTRCPNCGSPRPADVRFYLPQDAETVEDEERQQEARAGADWRCGHCSTQNKASESLCHGCGNPRDESSQDATLTEREYGSDEVPMGSFAPKRTLHPSEQPRPQRRRNWLKPILMLALLIGGGYGLLRMFPNEVEVEVAQFDWERQIQLEHHERVAEEAWRVPSGAEEVESFRAIRDYKKVLKGYETRTRQVKVKVGTEKYVCGKIDKGNGYFVDKYCTRPVYEYRDETYEEPVYAQVPIYDTKYRFKVWRWMAHASNIIRSQGQGQQAHWPEDQRLQHSDWRAGPKKAHYYITVREKNGDTHREAIDPDRWAALKPGQRIKARKAYLLGTWYGLVE